MKFKALMALCLTGLLLVVSAQRSVAQSAKRTGAAFVQPTPRPLTVDKTAPDARTIAADTTLLYYDIRTKLFDVNLRRSGTTFSRALGMIIDAPFDGTIDRVDFELSNFAPSPGVAGTGKLRIKLVELPFIVSNPPFQPGIDSIDVDLADLTARGFVSPGDFPNQIDVTGSDFEIAEGEQYFLQLALVEESNDAVLTFVFDEGSDDKNDTRYFVPPDMGARTLVYVDSLGADTNDCSDSTSFCDDFLSLRDPSDTTFVNLNVLLELQLTKAPPPPPPPADAIARMQFIHNVSGAGPVDVYVNDSLVIDDKGFREATRFMVVPAGEQTIDVVDGSAGDNGSPLFSTTTTFAQDRPYWAVALGGQTPGIAVAQAVAEGNEERKISYMMMHGAEGADAINVNLLDETSDHAVISPLAINLAFGAFAGPVFLDAGLFNVEVAADNTQLDVFRLEVGAGNALETGTNLLMTSGISGGDPALAFLTVKADSTVKVSPVSTATEDRAVPEQFALHGNFPNPFNPSTTIRFDLGTPGFTTLMVYNLLGQEVAALVAEPLTAGAYAMRFDATGLPSGLYFYRLTSGAFSEQRMLLLVK